MTHVSVPVELTQNYIRDINKNNVSTLSPYLHRFSKNYYREVVHYPSGENDLRDEKSLQASFCVKYEIQENRKCSISCYIKHSNNLLMFGEIKTNLMVIFRAQNRASEILR